MAVAQSTNWSRVVRQAVIAGIVGGIVIDLFLYVAVVAPSHGSMTAMWQWVASGAFGKAAFASPAFIWIGLLVHFIVSICWAGGYAFLASTRPYMNARWPISGLVYGFVVMVFMVLLQLGANVFQWPGTAGWFISLVAHTAFFGLPVAFTVSRLDRA